MILLDTDFLIEFLKGDPQAVKKHKSIHSEILAISSITVLELSYGELKKYGELLSEQFFENYLVLPFSQADAKKAASLRVELEKSGGRIGLQDEMIAATALINNAKILTGNIRHFKRVKGLNVESW